MRRQGHSDLRAFAERGYWGSGHFYVRIAPSELKKMEKGVPYTLIPQDSNADYRWIVPEGTTITR